MFPARLTARLELVAATVLMALTISAVTGSAQSRTAPESEGAGAVVRWVVAPSGNQARYLVREQLARLNFPNDAVGVTSDVTGGVVVDEDGRIVPGESAFVINLATLKSDYDRRDSFLRENTLETAKHPRARLVPTEIRGQRWPLPSSGPLSFELVGDLTLRGVTRPTVWQVTAVAQEGRLTGKASTKFTFDQFQITKPRVGGLLSVADDIRLEYDFTLVRR